MWFGFGERGPGGDLWWLSPGIEEGGELNHPLFDLFPTKNMTPYVRWSTDVLRQLAGEQKNSAYRADLQSERRC